MNKEELNEIESLDIVLNDVGDLDMGLEVISYKARVCIQELSKVVIEQSKQLQAYKDKEDKIDIFVKTQIEIIKRQPSEDRANDEYFIDRLKNILDILNEGEKK